MQRFIVACRLFWYALFGAPSAESAERLLLPQTPEPPAPEDKPSAPPKPAASKRSEALTLLAALQREARFVDFVMESLDAYSDEQIGAAARDVHRGCRTVLQRMFDVQPVREEPEGTSIKVPAGFDQGLVRLSGQVAGEPPFRGSLQHAGWKAGKCELPTWTGEPHVQTVIAPAEVEVT